MFDELFCDGGRWFIDFILATFSFILLLGGGYLTYISILLGCLWEVFFTFSLWVLDGQLFTKNSKIEVFEPDNWDLIIKDSEIPLSPSVNEYWGPELFTHFCIKFLLTPVKIGIVHLGIYLYFFWQAFHLEGFGVEQGLHFQEGVILLL